MFENKIYGIEEGVEATKTSCEMIKAYGLDREYVVASEAGILAQASRLIEQQKPVIF